MELQPNDVFDRRYRVIRTLGKGSYGSVYEVARVVGHSRLALKLLHAHLALNEEHRRRFLREAALVERLDHPNIVKLVDVGETQDGTLFVAFEYLEGHTLDELRERMGGRVHPATVVGWMTQLLSVLAYAHSQGVVHRDIKPANLMVVQTAQGEQLKVLDFGVAKAVSGSGQRTALTSEGTMLGTPFYLAPEQVRGEEIDARADLYAVGLTMVRLLTGEVLVEGDNEFEMVIVHLSKEPHQLPAELQASPLAPTLRIAIAKDRSRRFASAEQMLASLNQVVAVPTPVQTHPVHAPFMAMPSHAARVSAPNVPSASQSVHSGSAGHSPPASPARASKRKWPLVLTLVLGVSAITVAGGALWNSRQSKLTSNSGPRPADKAAPKPAARTTRSRTKDKFPSCQLKSGHYTHCPGLDAVGLPTALRRIKANYKVAIHSDTSQSTFRMVVMQTEEGFAVSLHESSFGKRTCPPGIMTSQPDEDSVNFGLTDSRLCVTVFGHKKYLNRRTARKMLKTISRP